MLTRLRARAGGRRAAPVTTTTTTTTTTRREHGGVGATGVGATGVGGSRYKRSRFGRRNRRTGYGATTGGVAAQPMRRRASIGDKVSGALMKLRGSLTRRPGLKVCGEPESGSRGILN
jgi:hypothetical protein